MKNLVLFILVVLITSCSKSITCDKFILNSEIQDNELLLTIDSDLPDFTDVIITCLRKYTVKDQQNDLFIEYYSVNEKLSDIDNHISKLDEYEWIMKLNTIHKEMNYYLDLVDVSDSIFIKFEIPLKQSSPKFGENNSNLTGKQVNSKHKIIKNYSLHSPLFNEQIVLPSKSYDIILPPIPRYTINKYLYLKGRINPNYSLYIDNKLIKPINNSDKFDTKAELKQIRNNVKIKLLSTTGKIVYEKDYLVIKERFRNRMKSSNSVFGKWVDNSGAMKGVIYIYKKNNIIHVDTRWGDGSISRQIATSKIINATKRYYVSDSADNEYFTLGKSNKLRWFDSFGLFEEYKKQTN